MAIKTLISEECLQKRTAELAKEISADGHVDVLVGALTGAFIFVADLARALNFQEMQIQFVKARSYGNGTERSSFSVEGLNSLDVKNKNVLIVDDIFDTGYTLKNLSAEIQKLGTASVRTCALLDKPSRREVDFQVNYLGFQVENVFVIGYGLDHAEKFRALPKICIVED